MADELRQQLPQDVQILTRSQLRAREEGYWIISTSTGIIFGSGVIVALLFGLVITYQVLSLEVSHRQGEYAALKAVGFSDSFLAWVVIQQAILFAVLELHPRLRPGGGHLLRLRGRHQAADLHDLGAGVGRVRADAGDVFPVGLVGLK